MELRHNGSLIRLGLLGLATLVAASVAGAWLFTPASAEPTLPLAADELAARFLGAADASVPEAVTAAVSYLPVADTTGPAVADKTRLVRSLGDGVAIYAFPTTKGSVCFVVTLKGTPGTCVHRFDRSPNGIPVAPLFYYEQGSGTTVAGLAPAAVKSVDILTGDRIESVPVVRNTFYRALGADVATDEVSSIVVHYADGSSLTRSN